MASTSDGNSEPSADPRPATGEVERTLAKDGSLPARADADQAAHPGHEAAPTTDSPDGESTPHPWRKRSLWVVAAVGLAFGVYWLIPVVETMLNTISTDDAYVNGHVTFVAPRVAGQLSRVLVDDNYRVKKGAVLVQLDKEPDQVQVAIKQAAVVSAERDVGAAVAKARGQVAQTRSNRFKLERGIQGVNNQIATIGANVATLNGRKAILALARFNLKRGEELAPGGGISKEDLDIRRQTVQVDVASVEQALQTVYASRVGLGLPAKPAKRHDLAEVPPELEQNFSAVREALADALRSAAQFGNFPTSWDQTPTQAIADFYEQEAQGDRNRIYERLVREAPVVQQAEAKLVEARRDLDQANLNLRYCDIVSEIDGVVTRRNVNPGNNILVGQSLMAVRSLTEIWIDANFKETQLGDLRIGQRVRCEVDMYGSRREYKGRITGFTMGTGSTLALLPAQNATGNFVKVVQRLPVRIELTDYDPDKAPLFVGLSVVPYVSFKEPPTGPHAGDLLQPLLPLPEGPAAAGDRKIAQTKAHPPEDHSAR